MGLRDRAVELQAAEDRSAIGQLVAALNPEQTDDVTDLLWGEPRIPHTIVAEVLNEEFGVHVSAKQVEDYRRKHRP